MHVHENTQSIQYKQEPYNVSFLCNPIHVLNVHCKAEIEYASTSHQVPTNQQCMQLLLHKKIHALLLT